MVDEHSLGMIQPGAVKHQLARMPCQLMAQVTWYSRTWDSSAPQVALLLKSTDVKPVATKPSNHIQSDMYLQDSSNPMHCGNAISPIGFNAHSTEAAVKASYTTTVSSPPPLGTPTRPVNSTDLVRKQTQPWC